MDNRLQEDRIRYAGMRVPPFQKYFRKVQQTEFPPLKMYYKLCLRVARRRSLVELFAKTQIGGGLYIGHAYCMTINENAVIGRNVNLHKGVTIGQENRGKRKGSPVIGDRVWIGVNATIVGNVRIGSDVLVAPNSYVNCDVPDHSIVFGNPCIIKSRENATEGYINHCV